MKKLLTAVTIAALFSSCSNYYQAITATEPTKPTSYNNFQDSMKYYVLRNGSEAFAMKNISISSDQKNIQCTLTELPFEHKLYVTNGARGNMKYKTKSYTYEDETGVLNEVHIYLLPGIKVATGPYTLALENVQRAEIIEKNKVKTRKSYIMGTSIGIGIAVPVIVVVVAAIVASSNGFFSF